MTATAGRRIRSDQRGAAAVEFALVLPVLLALVLGGIDWGYYFFVAQVTTNAAREGARAGSLEFSDDGVATGDATTTAQQYIAGAGLDGSAATINVSLPGDAVQVQVSFPVGSITGFTQSFVPAQAVAVAEMRRR